MATLTINVNANGDESNLSGSPYTGGDRYKNVISNDGDTSLVGGGGGLPYERDLYNLDNHSTEAGTITNVRVNVRCKESGGAGYAMAAIKSGGVAADGAQETLTISYALYYADWATPPEGGSWTWAKVDALQAGVSLKSTDEKASAFCTQVFVVVTYTPPPPLGSKSAGMAAKMVAAGLI